MAKKKGVSIIIPVWNQLGYTKLSVESMVKNAGSTPFELIIVDNGSRPETRDYFDKLARGVPVRYIRNENNLGPIRAINQGIDAASYRYVMAIHNDVAIFEPDWLGKIVSAMEADPRIGIAALAGRQEIYKEGNVNEATLKHSLRNEEDLCPAMKEESAEVAVVDGLCFVMSEALLDGVKHLDETYGYMHCYDFDISLESISRNFRNVVLKIEAMHLGNGGRTRFTKGYGEFVKNDSDLLKRNYKIFAGKWSGLLPLKVGGGAPPAAAEKSAWSFLTRGWWARHIGAIVPGSRNGK
jgi:glycosyltransferase involved in cell wall biosynthesis